MGSVVFAHEPQLQQASTRSGFRLHDRPCLVDAVGERLLAQNRLSGSDAGERVRGVGHVGRGDDDRVDVNVVDNVEAVGAHERHAKLDTEYAGTVHVGIRDRDQFCRRSTSSDVASMHRSHQSRADDAHSDRRRPFLKRRNGWVLRVRHGGESCSKCQTGSVEQMLQVEVESPDDPRLDTFRNLKRQPVRTDGRFVAESELVLTRLFESKIVVRAVLLTQARAERLGAELAAYLRPQDGDGTTVFVASQATIDEVVGYPLNRGVIAVAERPTLPPVRSLLASARTVVVMERVMDPENVGSVFRHAAGFGVDAVLLHGPTGDPLYRKAIRISMGWSLAIPYAKTEAATDVNALLSDAGFVTLALTPARDAELLTAVVGSLDSSARVAILVGAEGPGLEASTLASAAHRVRIPLAAEVDSLNVATALAIALHSLTTAQPSRLERR